MSTDLYLASASPRRHQLLEQLGLHCEIRAADIDETPQADESPQAYVQRLALAKAQAVYQSLTEQGQAPCIPVLGADTSVVFAGQIFGKPSSQQQAREMLTQLSGHTHEVMTAVALVFADAQGQPQSLNALNVSQVRFAPLSISMIEDYIATDEPFGKAGAYAIQGRAAGFIEHLQGSYSGVMGLPLFDTLQLLRRSHHAGSA